MDMKTLEYLEQRVKTGKEIQKSIERLKTRIEKVSETVSITFADEKPCFNLVIIRKECGEIDEAIATALIETFKEVATEQIDRLEKEFAEL